MDKPQLEVLQINSTGGAWQKLQPEVTLAHCITRPGTTFGRFISEPFDLAVDALEACWDGAVVFAVEEGVCVGVGEGCGYGFPWNE
jgi:hypothetical protein